MQLQMFLGNDFIEAVNVHQESLSQPGYLGQFKRVLKDKYAELIRQSGKAPEFLVVDNSTARSDRKAS